MNITSLFVLYTLRTTISACYLNLYSGLGTATENTPTASTATPDPWTTAAATEAMTGMTATTVITTATIATTKGITRDMMPACV